MAATSIETRMPAARNGHSSRHGETPAAFITMISESEPSRLSTWPADTISAIGAMIMTRSGTIMPVMPTKTKSVWRSLVIRSKSRIAWVNQITTVKVISVIRNATIVVRNMYRVIDPIGLCLAGVRRLRRIGANAATSLAPDRSHLRTSDAFTKWPRQGNAVSSHGIAIGGSAGATGTEGLAHSERTLHDGAARYIRGSDKPSDPAATRP